MSGAKPLYLSCSLILEEGLPIETLSRVLKSMAESASAIGVKLVTGDTKVVEKGKGDGIYINTSGIGIIEHNITINAQQIENGDLIILSGDIGRHGMAIMAQRAGLEFDNPLNSDCDPLNEPVQRLLTEGIDVHCLRDLTRGGLATALIELAESAEKSFIIEETSIPLDEAVIGACEMLGLDPCYVANEGRFVAFVPADQADKTLALLQTLEVSERSCIIGSVGSDKAAQLTYRSSIGSERLLHRLTGEQLPRIC